MKRIIVVLLILALLVLAVGCSADSAETGIGDNMVGTETGQRAPDFQLQTLDGAKISLRSLQSQPLLLNFWATWCGPCRSEMPYLEQVYQQHHGELVLLTVNIRESSAEVSQFIQTYGYSFDVLLDSNGKVADDYGIQYIPITFVIDADGIISDAAVGSFSSHSELEHRLGQIFT